MKRLLTAIHEANKATGKITYGSDRDNNYVYRIAGVAPDFHTAPLGRQLDDLAKIKAFKSDARHQYIAAKGKATLAAVKRWIEAEGPDEVYASWKKDTENYKDDSVLIYYTQESVMK